MADPLRFCTVPLAVVALALGLSANALAAPASTAPAAARHAPALKQTPPASVARQPSAAPAATALPTPKVVGASDERFWGFMTATVSFGKMPDDPKRTAWAVRYFVQTDSLEAAFAQLVEAPESHPHATVYCKPMTVGKLKGVLISVALLGKDPARSEQLRDGEHVVVRILQRHARSFVPIPPDYGVAH